MKTFNVFQKMSEENMDIRLAPLGNILRINVYRGKGEVIFGVDQKTAQELLNDIEGEKFVGGLLLADKTQFNLLHEEADSDPRVVEWIGRFCGTMHCEKGGCLYSECPVWIIERLIACEPLGVCAVCDEPVVVSLQEAIDHYHDPSIGIYCCESCRSALEGDFDDEEDKDE